MRTDEIYPCSGDLSQSCQTLRQVFVRANGHELVETGAIRKVRWLQPQSTEVQGHLAVGSKVFGGKRPHVDKVSVRGAKSSGDQSRKQRIPWPHLQCYEVQKAALFPGGRCRLKVSPENLDSIFRLFHPTQPERSYPVPYMISER